jgi:hypothetical protein
MSQNQSVRWGWLNAMYIYTIIGAGVLGMGMILAPESVKSLFGWPCQDPVIFGIVGSFYISSGLMSILGLRSPLKFSPVLLLQLCYKVIWFFGVLLPLLIKGEMPSYALVYAAIFATYIIGDLIAIPFSYIFARESGKN